ncbi:MAG: helix-turn-helix domain-containing protein [Bacteroidia bacterium]
MKNSTLIHDLTPEEFQDVILKVVKNQFDLLKKEFKPKEPNVYLTRNDLAEMLKIDLSTIHNWCKKGKLNPVGIGNRVYFLRAEVEAGIISLGKGGQNNE